MALTFRSKQVRDLRSSTASLDLRLTLNVLLDLVDVYDALTSDRPYREAWSEEAALAHIRGEAGRHFDPEVVEVFMRMEERA